MRPPCGACAAEAVPLASSRSWRQRAAGPEPPGWSLPAASGVLPSAELRRGGGARRAWAVRGCWGYGTIVAARGARPFLCDEHYSFRTPFAKIAAEEYSNNAPFAFFLQQEDVLKERVS